MSEPINDELRLGIESKFRRCPKCHCTMERVAISDPTSPTELMYIHLCEECGHREPLQAQKLEGGAQA